MVSIRPKQPGHDGGDPRPDKAAIDLPFADGELASGAASLPSWAIEPIGFAQQQTTTREPGKDEMTAIKEQKIECGEGEVVVTGGRDPATREGDRDRH
jgi:hypothetical protein